jgi:hypothetical protein
VVRVCLHHAAYRQWLRQQVLQLPAAVRANLPLWDRQLHFAWQADLDPVLPLLCARYSREGRPARDPGAMLRCLLLMTFCCCRRLSAWHQRLLNEPVLAIAAGFPPQDVPRTASLFDFLRRCFPGPHRRRALRRPAARRLRLKAGAKLPPARRAILRRVVSHLLHSGDAAAMPDQVWNQMLAAVALSSVERGLIPHAAALTVAADGMPLESGCYSQGHKTCQCPKMIRCEHPRLYTDPGALNGWDSYRSRWYVGRSLQTLIEADSGHGLPLWLALGPANRNDACAGAVVLHRAVIHYGPTAVTVRRGLFDKAYEGEPFLQLCYHHRIDPIVARTRPAKLKAKIARRLAQSGVHLAANGVPICAAGLSMQSHGHSKPHVWAWRCPRAGQCPTPCPFATKTLCLNALQDPRALTPEPSATPARKALFKCRTAIERFHSWIDLCEVQNARHIRDYLWFGRCALAAITWHCKAWAGKPPANWTQHTFFEPS